MNLNGGADTVTSTTVVSTYECHEVPRQCWDLAFRSGVVAGDCLQPMGHRRYRSGSVCVLPVLRPTDKRSSWSLHRRIQLQRRVRKIGTHSGMPGHGRDSLDCLRDRAAYELQYDALPPRRICVSW